MFINFILAAMASATIRSSVFSTEIFPILVSVWNKTIILIFDCRGENISGRDLFIEIRNSVIEPEWLIEVLVHSLSTSFACWCWSIWFSVFSSKPTFIRFHAVKFWSEGFDFDTWQKWDITLHLLVRYKK